jgi:hypothetical protein
VGGFTAGFYETFKELTPILLKLPHEIEREHYQTHSVKPVLCSFSNQIKTQQKEL